MMFPELSVGTKLYGYLNGYLTCGYEYSNYTIEARGTDWLILRDIDGNNAFMDLCDIPGTEGSLNMINDWKEPK